MLESSRMLNAQATGSPPSDANTAIPGVNDPYLQLTRTVERLHRRFLDVLRFDLQKLGVDDINAVQALMLTNLDGKDTTIRDLVQRGYYLGSNASYNIKHLVGAGYVEQERALRDKRTVYVRLTDKGRALCAQLDDLEKAHADTLAPTSTALKEVEAGIALLKRLERIWSDHLRYAGP